MSTIQTKSEPIMKTLNLQRVDIRADKSPGKRDLARGNEDCQLYIKDKLGEQTDKTRYTFLDIMDALAYGVEARLEENAGYSRRITEEVVTIARKLAMPEDEIERWAASRLIYETEKLRVIKAFLEGLQRSSPDDRVEDKGH